MASIDQTGWTRLPLDEVSAVDLCSDSWRAHCEGSGECRDLTVAEPDKAGWNEDPVEALARCRKVRLRGEET